MGDSLGKSLLRSTIAQKVQRVSPPIAKVVPGKINGSSGFIARIDFSMYNMRFRQRQRQDIVNMCREALETSLISHETVYVYEKQFSASLVDGLDG